jgi:DNA-binding PucR family transcriptional regulator
VAVEGEVLPDARIERAVQSETDVRGLHCLCARDSDTVYFIFESRPSLPAEGYLESIRTRLGLPDLRGGLSRRYTRAVPLERLVREARLALEAADVGQIVSFCSVELSNLLDSIPEAEYFVAARLAPLLASGAVYADLRETLDVYLAGGRNVTEASRRLGVHRNTMHYRLDRLRSHLGADMDDPDNAFALQVALRLLHTMRVTRGDGDTG